MFLVHLAVTVHNPIEKGHTWTTYFRLIHARTIENARTMVSQLTNDLVINHSRGSDVNQSVIPNFLSLPITN